MRLRKTTLAAVAVIALPLLVALIVVLGGMGAPAASPVSQSPTRQNVINQESSQPQDNRQNATASATVLVIESPSPSATATYVPPLPTEMTVALTSAPSPIPLVTPIQATVTEGGLSDPFDLPAGLYRVTLRTDSGYSVMQPVVEDGSCSEFPLFGTWSGPFEGSASYRSTGCRVRFEVVGISGSWAVEVALESSPASPPFPVTFSGKGPAVSDIIVLPEGEYTIHFETDSPAIVTPVIVDGLCLERPVILATQPGNYDASYDSTGCTLLFQVSDAAAGWVISIALKG